MAATERRDRGALFALGMALIAIVLAAAISAWSESRIAVGAPVPHTANPGDHEPPSTWDRYTSPEDTYAQWLMALFSFFATAASIWAVVVVRTSLTVTREATLAAVAANGIAQRNFEAEQRPWIRFEDIPRVSLIRIGNDKNYLAVSAMVRNTGKSPAEGVTLHLDTQKQPFLSFGNSTARKHGERITDDGYAAVRPNVVFAGETERIFGSSSGLPDYTDVQLSLCIAYRAAGFSRVYYTAQTMRLQLQDDAHDRVEDGAISSDDLTAGMELNSLAMT